MRKLNFYSLLMALVAMSFFETPTFAQAEKQKAFTPKIKTPNTSNELKDEFKDESSQIRANSNGFSGDDSPSSRYSAATRKLQQHGIGLGIGQTFLMGNYAKYGDDKITLDLLYSYAASYSFDLLINAHMSEHKDENDRMKVMGLTTSFKGRFVEFDNFSPFFLGGLGFYSPEARRNGKWTDQKISFGINFGGGVDLRLNDHYVVGLLAQLHWPFEIQQENQSDLRGYYSKLLITGMYLF